MRYLCITGGPLAENCYFLIDEASGEAAVIDPGFVDDRLLAEAAKYKVRHILLTHGHFDHIEGAGRLRALTGAPVTAFRTEAAFAADPGKNGSLLILQRPITCAVDRLLDDGEQFSGVRPAHAGAHGGRLLLCHARGRFYRRHADGLFGRPV